MNSFKVICNYEKFKTSQTFNDIIPYYFYNSSMVALLKGCVTDNVDLNPCGR